MTKTLTLIGLAVALAVPQAALAVTSTGYGTEGPYHARHGAPLSNFQRGWNNAHEFRTARGRPQAGYGATAWVSPLRSSSPRDL